jgi:hypothetical protein
MSHWDSWKDGYDVWKLATPPEYEGEDEPIGDEDVDDTEDREPPQHDAHVAAYYNSLF